MEEQEFATNAEKREGLKAKRGMKPFAFFSGLVDVIVAIFIFAGGVMMLLDLIQAADTGNEQLNKLLGFFFWPFLVVIGIILLGAGVLWLVDGILALISSFKSDRRNFNGVLIATGVFDGFLLVFSIFLVFATDENAKNLYIGLSVLLAVTFVFKIVDIVLTKKRLKKYEAAMAEEHAKSYQGPDFSKLGGVPQTGGKASQQGNEPQSGEANAQNSSDNSQLDSDFFQSNSAQGVANETQQVSNKGVQSNSSQGESQGDGSVDFSKLGE